MTTVQLTLSPEVAASDARIREEVAHQLSLPLDQITSIQIRRRNIDARQRRILRLLLWLVQGLVGSLLH